MAGSRRTAVRQSGFVLEALSVPKKDFKTLDELERRGMLIAAMGAEHGEMGLPGGIMARTHLHTFEDLQTIVDQEEGWGWWETEVNHLAHTDTLPAACKRDRRRALEARDADRVSRGEGARWAEFDTFVHAARCLQLDKAGVAKRGHCTRMFGERHWSVGHNRCKGIRDP
jgi:hypothetical protein